MKSSLKKQAERFLREQKNYKRWLAVFLCLAVVVTIGTTAALKYKGIAVTTDNPDVEVHTEDEEIPEGMRRHVHTEACYAEQPVLVCEAAEAEAGETAEAGVGETAEAGAADAGTSNAGAAEESKPADTAQGHTHSDSCYEVTGGTEKLTCAKEEHTHGDGCYETTVVTETVTKTVPETVNEEVTDEDGNVTTVSKTVDKTVEETVEKEEKVLTCAKEEHSHGASCYTVEGGERTLVCGKEEGEGTEAPAAEEAVPAVVNADAAAVPAAETVAPAAAEAATENAPATEAASTADAEAGAVTENTDTADAADAAAENTENADAAEETTGEHVHDDSCYELQMVLICGKEEGELEEIPIEFAAGTLECVTGNVKVIATYSQEAEIPANAELRVEEITEESDPEYYAECEAEYLEHSGEGAVMDMLLDIGIYAEDEEIEPKASVEITIEMLDDSYEDGEELNVVHFGETETEKLDTSAVETNDNGNKITSFTTSSFSPFGVGPYSISEDLYIIHYGNYVLAHKDETLKAVEATVSSSGGKTSVTLPSGYEKEDLYWTRTEGEYIGYNGDYVSLSYKNRSYAWELGTKSKLTIQNGTICGTANSRNRYLNYSSRETNGITAGSSSSTQWEFASLTDVQWVSDPLKTTITLQRYDALDDSYNPGIKNLVKVQFDLLDIENQQIISNVGDFPNGWTILENAHTFEVGAQGELAIDAAMLNEWGVNIPGYTYENGWAFFWWGGNNQGSMNNVPVLRNFGEVSGKYTGWNYVGYQINPPKQPITGTGNDYVYDLLKKAYDIGFDRDSVNSADDYKSQYNPNINEADWFAYNPTGTLHIVLVKAGKEVSYKVNFVDAYRAEEQEFSKYTVIDQQNMIMSWTDSSWTGSIDGLTDKVPAERKGHRFVGWYTDKDENGNGTGTEVEITGDKITIKNKDGGDVEIDKLTDTNQTGNNSDRYYYAKWERITDKYSIEKKWDATTEMINPLVDSVQIRITRSYENGKDASGKIIWAEDTEFNTNRENVHTLSSPSWKVENVVLPQTDEDSRTYKYEMHEVKVTEGDGTEIPSESFKLKAEQTTGFYTLTNVINPDKTVKLNVKKTDEDGNPLEGARFKLVKVENGNDKLIGDQYISKGEGEDRGYAIKNGSLVEGKYALIEEAAPDGYAANKSRIEFEVIREGTDSNWSVKLVVPTPDEGAGWSYDSATNTITVVNKKVEQSVTLLKKETGTSNDNAIYLDGAEFTVYYEKDGVEANRSECGVWRSATVSGQVGVIVKEDGEKVEKLATGTYWLKETKAPDGYNLLSNEIRIVVSSKNVQFGDGAESVEGAGSITGNMTEGFVIYITNSAGIILPETGGPGTIAYTFGGLAMIIAVSLMYGLSMRRKREKGGLN